MSTGSGRLGRALAVAGAAAVGLASVQPAAAATAEGSASVDQRFRPVVSELVPDLSREAKFGRSVAVSGDTLVSGAHHDDANGKKNSGSATVYVRAGDGWAEQARLLPTDGNRGDNFGHAVDVDGDTVIVGAPNDNFGGFTDVGGAYVFVRSGSTWIQQARLTPLGARSFDNAGYAVAVSGDVAVLTSINAFNGDQFGRAFVFVRSGTTWTLQAELIASGLGDLLQFGSAAAIDGDTVVVGTFSANTPEPGEAHVFVRSGETWTQQAVLTAEGIVGHHLFGDEVGIDGDTILVGAPEDFAGATRSGAVYVFTRADQTWTEQARLVPDDPQANAGFGQAVAVWNDVAVVGQETFDAPPPFGVDGAAYVFTRNGDTWTQRQRLLHPDPGDTEFGSDVAIDGRVIAVGAEGDSSVFAYTA